ncbi:MAG: tripartite tricarboxylate transporter substrate binding protein [Alphaproteobacteria bacterium]|nr:tripartite tricarboxylate transporter substrate binding protein [Alphaproteobacteria bacterium]
MLKRRFLAAAAIGALGLGVVAAVASPAQAAWPDRPITIIVPFPAGGGVDLIARMLAQHIQPRIPNSRFVVVNRAGANGEIGYTAMAQAAPDGYTWGAVSTPGIIANTIERRTSYKLEDFTFVANLVLDPASFAVHKDSRFQNLRQMLDEARAKPGQLSVGHTGIGSPNHLMMLQVGRLVGASFNDTAFGGTAPTRTAMLGQHIDVGAFNIGEAFPTIRDGQARSLGMASAERVAMFPNVPTFREQGVDYVGGSTRGLVIPRGVPADVTRTIINAVNATVDDPAFRAEALRGFQPLAIWKNEEYARFIATETANLRRLWEQSPWNQR